MQRKAEKRIEKLQSEEIAKTLGGVEVEGQRCVCGMPAMNDNNNAIVTTTTLNGNCSSQYYVVFDRCCCRFEATLWALSTESLWTGSAVAIQNWTYNSQLTRKQFTIAHTTHLSMQTFNSHSYSDYNYDSVTVYRFWLRFWSLLDRNTKQIRFHWIDWS